MKARYMGHRESMRRGAIYKILIDKRPWHRVLAAKMLGFKLPQYVVESNNFHFVYDDTQRMRADWTIDERIR